MPLRSEVFRTLQLFRRCVVPCLPAVDVYTNWLCPHGGPVFMSAQANVVKN